jgi:hypothetical protein
MDSPDEVNPESQSEYRGIVGSLMYLYHRTRPDLGFAGICGVVGRATACVCGDAGSIPTGGALEVWPWTLGSKTAWLVNKSAGRPPF